MENCLKTKLKENVNNDNLERIDCLNFDVHSSEDTSTSNYRMSVYATSGKYFKINALNGGYFGTSSATIESEKLTTIDSRDHKGSVGIFCKNADFKLELENYQNCSSISMDNLVNTHITCTNIDRLKFGDNTAIDLKNNGTKSTSFFSKMNAQSSPITNIRLANLLYANIDDFSGLTTLQNIAIYLTDAFTGNIESLSALTSLTNINMQGSNSKIEGDLQTFIKNQRVTGQRVSGTISCNLIGSKITLGGRYSMDISSYTFKVEFNQDYCYAKRNNIAFATYDVANDSWS